MPRRAAEQPLAVPAAVGPRGVEEVAAARDGVVEGLVRLPVVGPGPASHAPHAVADLQPRTTRCVDTFGIASEEYIAPGPGTADLRVAGGLRDRAVLDAVLRRR